MYVTAANEADLHPDSGIGWTIDPVTLSAYAIDMIAIFLGITAANLIALTTVAVLGLASTGDAGNGSFYHHHVSWAVFSGLMTALTHSIVLTYFMATTKWLTAAADKANLDVETYVVSAQNRKWKALFVMLVPVGMTMITMVGGAAADTTDWWPKGLHLTLGAVTLLVNVAAAIWEYRLIRVQGHTIDRALEVLNRTPEARTEHG